jgi:hypothetical protein
MPKVIIIEEAFGHFNTVGQPRPDVSEDPRLGLYCITLPLSKYLSFSVIAVLVPLPSLNNSELCKRLPLDRDHDRDA